MAAASALAALAPLGDVAPADVAQLFSTGSLAGGELNAALSPAPARLAAAADALRRAVDGLDGAGADGRGVAQQLSEAEVDPRAAVVVLHHVMGGGAGGEATLDEQTQAVTAASCYVLLVRCIGEAFQPLVLRRALSTLRVRSSAAAEAAAAAAGGGTKRKAAGSRAAPAKRSASAAGAEESDESEDEDGDAGSAAAGDSDELARRRSAAVEDVATLVSPGPFSLSGYTDAMGNLVEVMVDLIAQSVGATAVMPFKVLGGVLGPQHGPPGDTMKLVLHALLPVMLANAGRSSGAAIPKPALARRNAAVEFVTTIMSDPASACRSHPVHLVALCQHMCMKVSDRAEYRRSTCQTTVKLLLLLPEEQLSHFTRFLSKYSKTEKALFRHFSCDLSLELLSQMKEMTADTAAAFSILKARSTDKAPTVRAKALTQLSACLTGPRATDLLGNGTAVDSLLALARVRSRDTKPAVRKSGLNLLCTVLQRCAADAADDGTFGQPGAQMEAIDPADIQIIAERCRDAAVTTRKAALQMLTDLLLAAPANDTVQDMWLKTVLPSVLDQQTTAVDMCCSLSYDVLLAPLVTSPATATTDLAWALLERIRNPDALQCLHKIIKLLHGMPKFTAKLGNGHATAAQRRLEQTGHSVGPWVLLEEIAHLGTATIDAELTWKTWEVVQGQVSGLPDNAPEQSIAVHALRVFLNCQLHASRATSAGKAIVSVVRKFVHTPQVTKAALDCLSSMAAMSAGSEKASGAKLLEWSGSIMSDCDTVLYDYMFGADAEAETDQAVHQRVVNTLFITGDISLMCAKAVPKRVISVLQALVSPADNAETGQGVRVTVPENVRAHAIVSLGKICLDDQSLAKKCVAAFSRELQDNKGDAPVIRNNIIFILSDLCRRFTSLVDPHLPLLSRCLGDRLPLVRKQTMLLLAGLLQEDYLKWKGPLFYRFLVMTTDPDAEIAAQARFILFTMFHKVDGKLLSNHFVEAIFYLNDFTEHETYNQFSQNDSDRSLFCLPGKDAQEKRMQIYMAMLAPLPDEQKLHITARLCHDVLARATDTDMGSAILDLDNECASQVLHDAMVILASKDIKLAASARKSAGDIDDDLEPDSQQASSAAAFTSAATAKVLSVVARKGSVEQTLPILVEVRRLLMERKSPLLRSLMMAVRETIKDYQDDIKHILTDRQLAAEIMYDLEQMKLEADREARPSHSPRAIASSPRVSVGSVRGSARGSARLSMTPARPTSLKDTFTPAVSARRGSTSSAAGAGAGRTTPFSVPRLRASGRASASPSMSARRSSAAAAGGQPTFAVPLPKGKTPLLPARRGSLALPSPIPSSLPLRVYNKQPGDVSATGSARKSVDPDTILMPSPFKSLPPAREWAVAVERSAAVTDSDSATNDENDEAASDGPETEKRLSRASGEREQLIGPVFI